MNFISSEITKQLILFINKLFSFMITYLHHVYYTVYITLYAIMGNYYLS